MHCFAAPNFAHSWKPQWHVCETGGISPVSTEGAEGEAGRAGSARVHAAGARLVQRVGARPAQALPSNSVLASGPSDQPAQT